MKIALIILLGNRDIQIHESKLKELKGQFFNYFVKNNEDSAYFIIDKFDTKKTEKSFREITEELWKEKKYIYQFIDFLLWEKTWNELKKSNIKPDKIFITTTKQPVPFKQDCDFVALLLEEHLKNNHFNTELALCENNPTDFEKMVEFYSALYDRISLEYKNIYISNSGGTPQMRTASHFAGIFRNYNFIAISSTDSDTTKTFQQQEKQILKNIILKMLNVYDYEGIKQLPVSIVIHQICDEALNQYNLKTTSISEQISFKDKSVNAIEAIYNNLYVCYKQGRYADAIGRIHRIEEAVGQLLLYNDFFVKGLINNKGKVKRIDSKGIEIFDLTFEKTIANRNIKNSILLSYYSDLFRITVNNDKEFINFNKYPSVPIDSGKNFYFFFFRSINKYNEIYSFFEKLNCNYDLKDNKLNNLRNRSILGHGFDGVSLIDIEEVTGNFDNFLIELKKLIQQSINKNIELFFDQINKKIVEILQKP